MNSGTRRIHRIVHQAGKLALSEFTIGLTPVEGADPTKGLQCTCDGAPVQATGKVVDGRMIIGFQRPLRLKPGGTMEISWDRKAS